MDGTLRMDAESLRQIRWQLSKKDIRGFTPLLRSIKAGDLDSVKFLIELGSPIDETNEEGQTALHLASLLGHVEEVRILLEKGASPRIEDVKGRTPWHHAAVNGHTSILDLLSQSYRELKRLAWCKRLAKKVKPAPPRERTSSSQSEKPEDKVFIVKKPPTGVTEVKEIPKTREPTTYQNGEHYPNGVEKSYTADKTELIKSPKTPKQRGDQAVEIANTSAKEDFLKGPVKNDEKDIEAKLKKAKEKDSLNGDIVKKKCKKTPEKRDHVDVEMPDREQKIKDSSKDDIKKEETSQKEVRKQRDAPKSEKKGEIWKTTDKEGSKEIKIDESKPEAKDSSKGDIEKEETKTIPQKEDGKQSDSPKSDTNKAENRKTPEKESSKEIEIDRSKSEEKDSQTKGGIEKEETGKTPQKEDGKQTDTPKSDTKKRKSRKTPEKEGTKEIKNTDSKSEEKASAKGDIKRAKTEKTPQKEDGKQTVTPKSDKKKGKSRKTPEKGKVEARADDVRDGEEQEEEVAVQRKTVSERNFHDELRAYYAKKRKVEEASKFPEKAKVKYTPRGDKKKDKTTKAPEKEDDEKKEIPKGAKTPEKKDDETKERNPKSAKTPEKNEDEKTKLLKSAKTPEKKDDEKTKTPKSEVDPIVGPSTSKKTDEASKDKDEVKRVVKKRIKRGGRKHKNRERAEDRKAKKAKRYEDSSLSQDYISNTSDSDVPMLPADEDEDFTVYLSHFPEYGDNKAEKRKMSSGYFDNIDPNKVDIRKRDQKGFTILHRAIRYGRLPAVRRMIQLGADVNELTNIGFSPVVMAALGGYGDIVKALVDAGADLKYANNDTGLTALHYAVFHRYMNAISMLLSLGADPNAQDVTGNTPLHFAVTDDGYLPVVECLVEYGADPNIQNNDFLTPLDLLANEPNSEIRKYLNMLRESRL